MGRLAPLLLATLLTASCDAGKPAGPEAASPAEKASPARVDVAALQLVADAACRCARSSPDDKSCWAELEAATAAYRPGESLASACFPISTSVDCFNDDAPDGGFCIVTGRLVTGGKTLCSAEEAKTVEAVFADVLERSDDDYQAATSAAAEAADALARGERLEAPDAPVACSG
jgi:hypothetical protein